MVGTMLALNNVLKDLFYRLWEAMGTYNTEKKYDQRYTFRKNILRAIKTMVCNTKKLEVQKRVGNHCNSL